MRLSRWIFAVLAVAAVAAALPAILGSRKADKRAPAASSGLTATVHGSTVALRWRASTDNVEVVGYTVWRRDNPGSMWSPIARTRALSYTDTAATAGTAYAYAVRANDAAGNVSASSEIVTANVPAAKVSRAVMGSVVWKADAERPLNQQWAEYSTATHCALTSDQVTRDPQAFRESLVVAQGSSAYEFVANSGAQNKCYGGERSEIGQGLPERANFSFSRQFNQRDDRWISFQLRLGRDFPVGDPNWDLIAQWKQNVSTTVVPGPMLALQVYSGQLWLGAAGGTADPHSSDSRIWRLTRVTTGRWIKISLHIKFDTNPKVGFVEVFGDADGTGMRRLFRLRHLSTLATDAGGNWVPSNARIGIYRNAVIPGTAHLYYDGYTVATGRAAAEASAFSPSRQLAACQSRNRPGHPRWVRPCRH